MFEGRIARFDEVERPFQLRTERLDGVGPGEILVRVRRTNVCASDLHAWHGSFATKGLGGQLPTVLGHEMVGSVAALGEGVATDLNGVPLAEGTRVVFPYFFPCHRCRSCLSGHPISCDRMTMAMLGRADKPPYFVGGFGEYFLLPAEAVVYVVPDTLPDEYAAGANCALSQVIYGLDRVGQGFGETVVVQGAGGLGLFATAVAKARGASTVITVDGVAERLELAKGFGADHIVDISAIESSRDRVKRVRELTGGRGADVVVEVVGSPAVIDEGLKMLGQFGRYLEIGNIGFGRTAELDPSRLVFGNKTIVGVSLYDPIVLGTALTFLEQHQHHLPLDRLSGVSYRLDEIDTAFADADSRRVVRAAIVP
ncbi:zinc-binding dehydrogenase [Agromyces bauzanensis]|uniref:Zinc-binding alcohol dehydrogenase n=1 Tax=Agromyces bauzanensis TaxID=1308924 RepID=A0A917PCF4_9MICO|nr:zinc-binding dehydrogenase [Agromyces bauzanensis]GGJ70838.1 zinc-binding alcohol dehydrogenase [Agromyces bauzanensis]